MDIYSENSAAMAKEKESKRRKEKEEYKTMMDAAAELLRTSKTDITKMSNKHLLILLKPLKRKEDGPMPTKKNTMLQKYNEWKHRTPLTFHEFSDESVVAQDHDANGIEDPTTVQAKFDDDDTAAVAQMMMEMGSVVNV